MADAIERTQVHAGGLYLNAKSNKLYFVEDVAKDSEDMQKLQVIYRRVWPHTDGPWARPYALFEGTTMIAGVETPRFKLLDPDEVIKAMAERGQAIKSRHAKDLDLPRRVAERALNILLASPTLEKAWRELPIGLREAISARLCKELDEEIAF